METNFRESVYDYKGSRIMYSEGVMLRRIIPSLFSSLFIRLIKIIKLYVISIMISRQQSSVLANVIVLHVNYYLCLLAGFK